MLKGIFWLFALLGALMASLLIYGAMSVALATGPLIAAATAPVLGAVAQLATSIAIIGYVVARSVEALSGGVWRSLRLRLCGA